MVIDKWAIVAIVHDEPERRQSASAIGEAERCQMPLASFVETPMVIEAHYGAHGRRDLDLLIGRARIEFASVDVNQAYVAREAFRRYGKGRHPARLNLGDCFAYAQARVLGEPLLCKDGDLVLTDITTNAPSRD